MISTKELTPAMYSTASRDFQLIASLFDVVLNSCKTNSELIYSLPLSNNTDERMADLIATTLGITIRHNYNVKQLFAVCSIFMKILRKKGSIEAVNLLGNTLLHAEGITENFACIAKENTLYIYMPLKLSDVSLFKDLLTYIVPAGMKVELIRATSIVKTDNLTVSLSQYIDYKTRSSDELSGVPDINKIYSENDSDEFAGNIYAGIFVPEAKK